ncbi:MAG: hypothetical protein JW726_19040 [Anaerolineales bacterium]|nr:hypothetical protein [Anaerolineales bacterium]
MVTRIRFPRLAFARLIAAIVIASFAATALQRPASAQADDPNPPAQTVKLIFIHHSTGENWLTDGYGDLGMTLDQNNYYVSDTNYGWGPDSIGDRTDIINWPEWFRSDNTPTYMQALFDESGQNSGYTRHLSDPGGENQIVMFKSCFPNSNLDGNPDDPPTPGYDFTVGNAKYIYNDLLNYFITRPDKLFIVITAPPVQDSSYADNARAFNQWLVQDWLRENNYPLNNVAVFDFYNILTHPDNHHRYNNGQIEHITSNGNNTLYYDSDGDDHPNVEGSQKATAEFIPLLNIFYHRWVSGAPAQPPVEVAADTPAPEQPGEAPASEGEPAPIEAAPAGGQLIDDFESGPPAGTDGWQAYWDESTPSSVACAPEQGTATQGNAALHIDFDIAANSWGTCALFYGENLSWQQARGISFNIHASQPALIVEINTHGGTPDSSTSYVFSLETTPEMTEGWGYVELTWDQLLGVDWEANPGQPFNPSQVNGVSFGFSTYPDTPNSGEIWVDELRLLEGTGEVPAPLEEPAATAPAGNAPEEASEQEAEPESSTDSPRLCSGSMALLGAGAVMLIVSKPTRKLLALRRLRKVK